MGETPPCPSCGRPLARRADERDGAVLDCSHCALIWCDAGALGRLVGHHEDLLDERPAPLPRLDVVLDARPCPRCPGVCLDRVPFARPRGPWIELCPYCAGTLSPASAIPIMRDAVARRGAPPAPREEPAAPFDPDLPGWRPLSLRQAALAVPVALLVSLALHYVSLVDRVFGGVRVSLHELGHAATAWACSWKALPTPVAFTVIIAGRSWVVFFGVLAAVAGFVYLGLRRRSYALVVGPALYALCLVIGTFGLAPHTQEMAVTFGGCGGELVFGALLVVLFHHRLPDRSRWDFFRWAALGAGAYVLVDASMFWWECARDWSLIRWEGTMGEDGDMTKLRDLHHWDEAKMTARYTALARWCFGVVTVWWAAHLAGAWRRAQSLPSDRPRPRSPASLEAQPRATAHVRDPRPR